MIVYIGMLLTLATDMTDVSIPSCVDVGVYI